MTVALVVIGVLLLCALTYIGGYHDGRNAEREARSRALLADTYTVGTASGDRFTWDGNPVRDNDMSGVESANILITFVH